MKKDLPILALTMGDPAGVGPEIIAKAIAHKELREQARLLVVGDRRVFEKAIAVTGVSLEVQVVAGAEDTGSDARILYLIDLDNVDESSFSFGELSAMCGRAAYESIEHSISLALEGAVSANVTAPINKEALKLAGLSYPGHTEIYADKTGTKDYAMMLVHDGVHVAHVTTHVSLREACGLVTKKRVGAVVDLANRAMQGLGVDLPRVAVAGLNPHAGENGMFGREEIEEITPALESARARGIDAVGPLPPDTVFPKAAGGEYDCVLAMYHDQGHIPLKMLGFRYDAQKAGFTGVQGVNITLGLPIIRTSVDHGTAFDVAGTGEADKTSEVEAILYAAKLAKGA